MPRRKYPASDSQIHPNTASEIQLKPLFLRDLPWETYTMVNRTKHLLALILCSSLFPEEWKKENKQSCLIYYSLVFQLIRKQYLFSRKKITGCRSTPGILSDWGIFRRRIIEIEIPEYDYVPLKSKAVMFMYHLGISEMHYCNFAKNMKKWSWIRKFH